MRARAGLPAPRPVFVQGDRSPGPGDHGSAAVKGEVKGFSRKNYVPRGFVFVKFNCFVQLAIYS
jgi:hypothetical protein